MGSKHPRKRGPKPKCLRIEGGTWEEAVKRALKKKRPKDGWPDDEAEPEDTPPQDEEE